MILQARMSSKRFPGKIIQEINGLPMIEILIRRIQLAKNVSQIFVVTSDDESDDKLVEILTEMKIEFYRGSLENVLSRFIHLIELHKLNSVVRLTGDNPLIDFKLLDIMIEKFEYQNELDYYSNTLERSYPKGLDIEIIKSKVLLGLRALNLTEAELEHVTLAIYTRKLDLNIGQKIRQGENLQNLRWTVDFPEDLEKIKRIINNFWPELEFDHTKILEKRGVIDI